MMNIYAKKVENKKQEEIFDCLWKAICVEKGAYYIPRQGIEERYLFENEKEEVVATLEFVPRNNDFSIVDKYHDFSQHEILQNKKIAEVGKISITKGYRGKKVLDAIMGKICEYAQEKKIDAFIGVMETVFKRSISISYGYSPIEAGESISLKKKGVFMQPVIIDTTEMVERSIKNGKFIKKVSL
jgi:hypothetical protein